MQRRTGCHRAARAISLLPRLVVAGLVLLPGHDAGAQVSGSASLVSDYRFRGASLSNGRPEPQLHLAYDGRSGWYVGGFASGIAFRERQDSNVQLMAYAGYAGRSRSALSWEAGVLKSAFLRAAAYDYVEIFAGLASDHIRSRIYFSPDYFGQHATTVYAELNGTYPLHQRLHLFGHLGWLQIFRKPEKLSAYPAHQSDFSIGVNTGLANWNVQLGWVAGPKSDEEMPFYGNGRPQAWTLSISYAF